MRVVNLRDLIRLVSERGQCVIHFSEVKKDHIVLKATYVSLSMI